MPTLGLVIIGCLIAGGESNACGSEGGLIYRVE